MNTQENNTKTKANTRALEIRNINTHYETMLKEYSQNGDPEQVTLANVKIPKTKEEDYHFIISNFNKICHLVESLKIPSNFVKYNENRRNLDQTFRRVQIQYGKNLARARRLSRYEDLISLDEEFQKDIQTYKRNCSVLKLKYYLHISNYNVKLHNLQEQYELKLETLDRRIATIRENMYATIKKVSEQYEQSPSANLKARIANIQRLADGMVEDVRYAKQKLKEELITNKKLLTSSFCLHTLPPSVEDDYTFVMNNPNKIYSAVFSSCKFLFRNARLRLKYDEYFQTYNELISKFKDLKLEYKTNLTRSKNPINNVDLDVVKVEYKKACEQFQHDLHCLGLIYYFKMMDYDNKYRALMSQYRSDKMRYQFKLNAAKRQNASNRINELNEEFIKITNQLKANIKTLRWERYLKRLPTWRAKYEQEIINCKLATQIKK